jgi:hypothetical protein
MRSACVINQFATGSPAVSSIAVFTVSPRAPADPQRDSQHRHSLQRCRSLQGGIGPRDRCDEPRPAPSVDSAAPATNGILHWP